MRAPKSSNTLLRVTPGQEEELEAAFTRGHDAIRQATGYRWARLLRQVENGSEYLHLVAWATLEPHTADFRGSALFEEWRSAVRKYFAAPPVLVHYSVRGGHR